MTLFSFKKSLEQHIATVHLETTEFCFHLDLSTLSTTTFGNLFISEADQAIYRTPVDFSASDDGELSQARCRDKSVQRDPVLDQCLKEEQQRKLMSGGTRYKAMQVCLHDFCRV